MLATDGVYVLFVRFCMYQMCVRGGYSCHNISIKQHSNNSTTPAVFQALAFVPVVTVYACMVGARQEVEPRQHFHVQLNNQTHVVGSHTRYAKAYSSSKNSSSTVRAIGTPMFPLFDLRRLQDIKSTPSRRGTL